MGDSVVNDQLPLGAYQPIASNWCHSVIELFKVDFEWTIHHYELRSAAREKFKSSTFSAFIKGTYLTWNLLLDCDRGVQIYQHRPVKGGAWKDAQMRVNISFINAKREKVFSQQICRSPLPIATNIVANETSRKALLENDVIVDGNLTIYCEVETCKDAKNLKGQIANTVNNHKEELNKDFQDLFENRKLSDVTFIVRGQQIKAHKIILAARSPVFAAMFEHPLKGNLTGIVDVPDIEANVFEELLRYIYTGQVPVKQMGKVAAGLLAAADKYLLEKLKKACGDHFVNKMSPKNCVKLLALEENDPAFYLMGIAVDYFRQFPDQVMATKEWKKAREKKAPWIWKCMEILVKSLVPPSKTGK